MITCLLGFSSPLAYIEFGMAAVGQAFPGTGLEPWICSWRFHRLSCVPALLCLSFPIC